ncbi:hypothetical protein [Caballeronia sp. dw_19]|uniref:hypothetical protein n=1 Tax=Caballeronia sp. dw_19 TaxID=2719791 RepID=UPI001BD4B347|nr:hypothetical protein [Caballeronia sp. dw_19]
MVQRAPHVETVDAETLADPFPSSQRLDAFLAQLRLSGFDLTPCQFAMAQIVLLAAEHDNVGVVRLGQRLALVLAGTRQDDFMRVYRMWFDRDEPNSEFTCKVRSPAKRVTTNNRLSLALVLLTLACVAAWLLVQRKTPDTSPIPQMIESVQTVQATFAPLPASALVVAQASVSWSAQRPILAFTPLVPCVIWLLLRLRNRALWFSHAGTIPLDANQRAVPVDAANLYSGHDMEAVARALARPTAGTTLTLDVMATAEATANQGGLITPVWNTENISPEYIFLVEKKNEFDHLAALADILIDQLEARGVRMSRYYFVGDPRVIHSEDSYEMEIRLSTIAARSRYVTFMVAATPDEFIHPLTGKPLRHVIDVFSMWETRIFLDLYPKALWTDREKSLVRSGFYVASASTSGLIALIHAGPNAANTPAFLEALG